MMNLEECYEELGGNYAELSNRLPSVRLIERFIGKFLEDQSFETLCQQMECKNREKAFQAAHTLKGVCANLSFTRLLTSTTRLTEALRPETSSINDETLTMLSDVKRDYETTVDAIRRYFAQ